MTRQTQAARDVVGVMTGTSIDGIDAALVRITGSGQSMRASLVRHISGELGPLAERLRNAAEQAAMTAGEFARLAWEFGLAHNDVIEKLLEDHSPIDRIVVHGQTVFHQPPYSWQLVNPAPIAARFQCPVVYELRQADLAHGGQGAPITPAADWVLFRDAQHARAIVNLGGYCNVTILPTGECSQNDVLGFDVCACNHVLDAVARRALGRPFDCNGEAASAGSADANATEALVALLQIQRLGGRSLGTGDESQQWTDRFSAMLQPHDLAASAVAAVARCIGDALMEHAIDEIIVAGGGARNAALLAQLQQHVSAPVRLSDELGIALEAREAVAIAILGSMSAGHAVFTPLDTAMQPKC